MCLADNSVVDKQITEENMVNESTQQEELERIDTMSILEAVAYANRLSRSLSCNECTDEEKMNKLELLRRLTVRVHFLKINLEPVYSSVVYAHQIDLHPKRFCLIPSGSVLSIESDPITDQTRAKPDTTGMCCSAFIPVHQRLLGC